MRTITPDELKTILEKHKKWLHNEEGGERANLDDTDLRDASLDGASLVDASLVDASLDGASLNGASLDGASLDGASLVDASLDGASLNGASLNGASLDGASLNRASLVDASLRGANLPSDLVTKFFPLVCPESGAFIGWKKAHVVVNCTLKQVIVKLQIPEDARRSSAFGRKCRCDKAVVLAIENLNGGCAEVALAASQHDSNFYYHVGETVRVDDFDDDRTHECAPGIHFFITRQEAVDY